MLTRKGITGAVTILLLLSFGPASYAKGWVYLGEAHVDGAADHDKIKVGRSEGRFRALQIKVDRAPVEFRHVVVPTGPTKRFRSGRRSPRAARPVTLTSEAQTALSRASRFGTNARTMDRESRECGCTAAEAPRMIAGGVR